MSDKRQAEVLTYTELKVTEGIVNFSDVSGFEK